MRVIQIKVRNLALPKGIMIQDTVSDEIGNFIVEYMVIAKPIRLPTS